MLNYYAYGLGILSEIHFPEFTQRKTNIDLIIRFGETDLPYKNFREFDLGKLTTARVIFNKIFLFWNNILVCSISDGNNIVVNPHTGLEENFLRLFILGYALAILLHQRGMLVLHANAVNMFDGAVVFLGTRGKGKSTTSLTLHKNGYKLLSDDVLSINVTNDFPIAYPSFPRIKLWPEVIRNLNENPELMPKISSNTEKRSYYVFKDFSNNPLPLKAIYIIERDNITKIENLSPQKGLIELIKSSYCYRLFNDSELYENLKQCTEIVNKVPVKTLNIKNSLEDLPKIIKIIEKDILESSK